jgi:DNA-binding NtrC family response regulator
VFEVADGGTLLLDEIGELSVRTQAKLLRILETGELTRVGATQPRRVNVRIVAATHRDLRQAVAQERFREDLFFRVSGFTLRVPPLRERREEIVPLAQLFLRRAARVHGVSACELTDSALTALLEHRWPGNVRELRHVIERAAAVCHAGRVELEHLHLGDSPPLQDAAECLPQSLPPIQSGIRRELRVIERERIVAALARTAGNQKEAAALLGVSRRTLTNKLDVYRIQRPRKRLDPAHEPGTDE